jgi:hypothetical protein
MKSILLIFLITSASSSQNWLKTDFGIGEIRKMEIFTTDYLKCENGTKYIYCKAMIRPNLLKRVLEGKYVVKDTITLNFSIQHSGFIIINDTSRILMYNCFHYPCDSSSNIINIERIIGKNVIRSSVKSPFHCKLMDSVSWKEISRQEYARTMNDLKFKKPDYGYIDSNFTSKQSYHIENLKHVELNCDKEYQIRRIIK